MPAKIRRSHNCVYMGGNLLDLGRWRDGPCRWVRHTVHTALYTLYSLYRWVRHTVDCLCEKVPDHLQGNLTDPVPILDLESRVLGDDWTEDYEYKLVSYISPK